MESSSARPSFLDRRSPVPTVTMVATPTALKGGAAGGSTSSSSEPSSHPHPHHGLLRRSLRTFVAGMAAGIFVTGLLIPSHLKLLVLPAGRVLVNGSGSWSGISSGNSGSVRGGNFNIGHGRPPEAAGADRRPSLTDAMAASFFALDASTGHILFPESVRRVVIDVGARESDYLTRLREADDRGTALILFDPMPHSYIPVANSASDYQLRNRTKRWLDEGYMNTVFPVRAALSDAEGTADFNIGMLPACGTLLDFKAGDIPHVCMTSRQKIKAVVLRLESILQLIPPRIQDVHVKVDTEGFDLNVLKGAGLALRRARTVVIECRNYKTREEIPTGTFNCSDAKEYVDTLGTFDVVAPPSKGHGSNMFWMQSNWSLPPGHGLSDYFHGPSLAFASFYGEVERILQAKSS